MKEIRASRTLGQRRSAPPGDRHQSTERGQRRPRGVVSGGRRNLVRESIPLSQSSSQLQLHRSCRGIHDQPNPSPILKQARASGQSPERRESSRLGSLPLVNLLTTLRKSSRLVGLKIDGTRIALHAVSTTQRAPGSPTRAVSACCSRKRHQGEQYGQREVADQNRKRRQVSNRPDFTTFSPPMTDPSRRAPT